MFGYDRLLPMNTGVEGGETACKVTVLCANILTNQSRLLLAGEEVGLQGEGGATRQGQDHLRQGEQGQQVWAEPFTYLLIRTTPGAGPWPPCRAPPTPPPTATTAPSCRASSPWSTTTSRRWRPSFRTSASKSSIRRFVITKKAPTRAFSWLKAATTAFTFKTQA